MLLVLFFVVIPWFFFFFFLVRLSLFGIVAIFVVKKILERGSFYIESRVTMFSNF